MSFPALTRPGLAELRASAGNVEPARAVGTPLSTYRHIRQIVNAALGDVLHAFGSLVTQLGSGRCVLMTGRHRGRREAGL